MDEVRCSALAVGVATLANAQSAQPGQGLVGAHAHLYAARLGHYFFVDGDLWFMSTYPAPPAGWDASQGPAIQYSVVGMLSHALQYVFAPIGFNWQTSIALVPGMAGCLPNPVRSTSSCNGAACDQGADTLASALKRSPDVQEKIIFIRRPLAR